MAEPPDHPRTLLATELPESRVRSLGNRVRRTLRRPRTNRSRGRTTAWQLGLWIWVGLAAATSASATPTSGATFKDWIVNCEQPHADGPEQCFIVQNLVLRDNNQRVMLAAIAYPPGKQEAVAVLTLPLGVALGPGVELQVDKGTRHRFAYERCIASGCKSAFILSGPILKSFKVGITAEITIVDGNQKPLTLPLSLRGFTAALQSLR